MGVCSRRVASGVRGIILREDGDQLVVQPSAGEVARFGVGRQVRIEDTSQTYERVSHDEVAAALGARPAINWSEILFDGLYDRHGNKVAVVESYEHSFIGGGIRRVAIRAAGIA